MQDACYIYILSNKPQGSLYVGVTNDLIKRIWEHKNNLGSKFCKKYNINRLVYFEMFLSIVDAIKREKQLKKYNRQWKINLIEQDNPEWRDLYNELANPVQRWK